MKRTARQFLQDIFDSVEKIEEYTENISLEKFGRQDEAIDAVIRRFEIIGEATKQLPASIRNTHPRVPWKKMAGIRDILVHEYFGVNIDRVWRTIQEDLPSLKKQIEKTLREVED